MSRIDNIPKSMLAARILNYGDSPVLLSVPVPEPAPHEILVRIAVGGLCHSDIQSIDGENSTPLPFTLGHEPVGIVAALGAHVSCSSFHLRQRVAFMNPYRTCGKCTECSNGDFMYCESEEASRGGITANGSFSEYAIADARLTFPLHDKIPFELGAPLMCAGVTTFNALKRANLPPKGSVAVIGCGGLGHLLVQFAVAAGYTVIGVDARQNSLDLVNKLGCNASILVTPNTDATVIRKQTQNITNGKGVDAAIVLTDALESVSIASAVTRKHGNVILVGAPKNPWPISARDLLFRDIRIYGTLLSSTDVCKEMLDYVVEHDIKIHCTTYPFENVAKMIEDYRSGKVSGRLVLRIASDEDLSR